ncbi:DEAD/DEAH box helicase family protein [Conchiformibius steedae]|uniref:DEAD/DEAH box helicase family protein n=1 Tax=Conchiformibius steedae TaxID=153493 RepID=UPI00047ADD0E|nr:DEAD/DEAH box helicase family protein [Conchiformibius steedae]QMT32614.1 DEAD/DEAH box helicase family protein [Conchiformibius steedae]
MAKASKIHFNQHLILNRWLLSLFHKTSLLELKAVLERVEQENAFIANDGHSYFYHRLSNVLFFNHENLLSTQDLAAYDLRLVQYWQKITVKRNQEDGYELRPKYFQYLSLLFTEIYLDWYFNRKSQLQTVLNAQLAQYVKDMGEHAQNFEDYRLNDLNKIAFWNATGSGKTLLMHVNILQYLHYFKAGKSAKPDKVIVLTPNEGLSRQHKEELERSGFSASFFDKNITAQTTFNFSIDEVGIGLGIEIIDVNKLSDKSGDKTVSVEAFDGNNLVLVDEGHRGTSGEQWLLRREALVKGGFAFEYSATLGQAVANGKTIAKQIEEKQKAKAKLLFNKGSLKGLSEDDLAKLTLDELEMAKVRTTAVLETYAKSVLFDYSYKHFYNDGYGKESLILNIQKQGFDKHLPLYFVAGLLSFYQQLYLFEQHKSALADWNIEKPLMVFVGHRVKESNKETEEQKVEKSDVLTVIRQLAFFVNEPQTVQKWLKDLLQDNAQLLNDKNQHIFKGRFVPLLSFKENVHGLYQDMLLKIFGASHTSRLRLTYLKKSDGELALSLGEHGTKFGVINIGDASGLLKTAQEEKFAKEFDAVSDEFNGGLFAQINKHQSPVNILVGSRKFTEGWSSWRVSTMGLLNMGRGEGSQIIQLFGRGVRLKGKDGSLKRSVPNIRPEDMFLEKLETLNIFGINADYMEVFRQYLADEDIASSDEMLTLDFPVQKRLPAVKLKTLRLKEEVKGNRQQSFKRVEKEIYLFEIPEKWKGKIKDIEISLDRYAKVQSITSKGNAIALSKNEQRYEAKLNTALFNFFDWDKIYLTISQFKHQQTWYNLRLDKDKLRQFAEKNDWYHLYIPKSALAVDSFAQIVLQQEILTDLLLEYVRAFYQRLKSVYERRFYEVVEVDEDNGSMLDKYQFSLSDNDEGRIIKQHLEMLANSSGSLKNGIKEIYGGDNGLQMLCLNGHLYAPIFACLKRADLPFSIQPLAIADESEWLFVRDLIDAEKRGKLSEWTHGKDLYLLRNASNKAKGLGFALAGNFYPDFLLWLVDNQTGKQWLSLIDPKGIRNMDLGHAKFNLHKELQILAGELNITTPILSAFILSITKQADLINAGHISTQEFTDNHILFMDNNQVYLKQMFNMILEG